MLRIILLTLLLCLSPVHARQGGESATGPVSLAELASAADLVVLAQIRDTDYLKRRDIPVSGSAYLKVLITYKGGQQADILEVYEKGLHPGECYFPNPTVFEEGRRYLLFLRTDPGNETRFRGLPQGCALAVLVNDRHQYALRFPLSGIALTERLRELAEPMQFSDPYAIVDESELLVAEREALHRAGDIEPLGASRWRFTRGVPLGHVRRLMKTGEN